VHLMHRLASSQSIFQPLFESVTIRSNCNAFEGPCPARPSQAARLQLQKFRGLRYCVANITPCRSDGLCVRGCMTPSFAGGLSDTVCTHTCRRRPTTATVNGVCHVSPEERIMPAEGSPRVILRIPQDLLSEMNEVIERRNAVTREEPWDMSAFIRTAIREKIAHVLRSRRPRPRKRANSKENP